MNRILNRLAVMTLLVVISLPSYAFTQACDLVAKMAGPTYQSKANRFGSMTAPEDMPKTIEASFIERNGAWFIYQAKRDWFDKDECAPKTEEIDGKPYDFMPVVLNKQSGVSAVITNQFLIKVYRPEHLEKLTTHYKFEKTLPLPNRFTAVFAVGQQASYDQLIETLDRDRDIEFAAPLLSEPRYRAR